MLFSDDIIVRGARRLLLEQILQRDAIEIIADDPLQPLPHGQSGACAAARARVRVLIKTGDRGEAAFRQAQDLADGILLRRARQPVTALIAARCAQNVRSAERGNDLLEVFF